MTTLVVGFDSAWSETNSGAIVGVLCHDDGTFDRPCPPQKANFSEAQEIICMWQVEKTPTATIVMIDQPIVVKNKKRRRPVENIVSSPVGRRYGGVQPANTNTPKMKKLFGEGAPVWDFLKRFGGAADPMQPVMGTRVFETYPVLAMIALDWTLRDEQQQRPKARLPKYNPDKTNFCRYDWQYVCKRVSDAFHECDLEVIPSWLDEAAGIKKPRKSDQDCLDACICLLVAMHFWMKKDCLMVGSQETGYMVVPYGADLPKELGDRCHKIDLVPVDWMRVFRST
jgi:predicted RNase H-like nuclease